MAGTDLGLDTGDRAQPQPAQKPSYGARNKLIAYYFNQLPVTAQKKLYTQFKARKLDSLIDSAKTTDGGMQSLYEALFHDSALYGMAAKCVDSIELDLPHKQAQLAANAYDYRNIVKNQLLRVTDDKITLLDHEGKDEEIALQDFMGLSDLERHAKLQINFGQVIKKELAPSNEQDISTYLSFDEQMRIVQRYQGAMLRMTMELQTGKSLTDSSNKVALGSIGAEAQTDSDSMLVDHLGGKAAFDAHHEILEQSFTPAAMELSAQLDLIIRKNPLIATNGFTKSQQTVDNSMAMKIQQGQFAPPDLAMAVKSLEDEEAALLKTISKEDLDETEREQKKAEAKKLFEHKKAALQQIESSLFQKLMQEHALKRAGARNNETVSGAAWRSVKRFWYGYDVPPLTEVVCTYSQVFNEGARFSTKHLFVDYYEYKDGKRVLSTEPHIYLRNVNRRTFATGGLQDAEFVFGAANDYMVFLEPDNAKLPPKPGTIECGNPHFAIFCSMAALGQGMESVGPYYVADTDGYVYNMANAASKEAIRKFWLTGSSVYLHDIHPCHRVVDGEVVAYDPEDKSAQEFENRDYIRCVMSPLYAQYVKARKATGMLRNSYFDSCEKISKKLQKKQNRSALNEFELGWLKSYRSAKGSGQGPDNEVFDQQFFTLVAAWQSGEVARLSNSLSSHLSDEDKMRMGISPDAPPPTDTETEEDALRKDMDAHRNFVNRYVSQLSAATDQEFRTEVLDYAQSINALGQTLNGQTNPALIELMRRHINGNASALPTHTDQDGQVVPSNLSELDPMARDDMRGHLTAWRMDMDDMRKLHANPAIEASSNTLGFDQDMQNASEDALKSQLRKFDLLLEYYNEQLILDLQSAPDAEHAALLASQEDIRLLKSQMRLMDIRDMGEGPLREVLNSIKQAFKDRKIAELHTHLNTYDDLFNRFGVVRETANLRAGLVP